MSFKLFPPAELKSAIKVVAKNYPVLDDKQKGISVRFKTKEPGEASPIAEVIDKDTICLFYESTAQALRNIGLLMATNEKLSRKLPAKKITPEKIVDAFPTAESSPFKTFGVMYDCSRNAVPKVETVKRRLLRLALLGYNRVMLYCEETYRLDGEPFFGFQRGGYTSADIREIDDYAFALGMEIVPCFQTLAHLSQIFRWDVYKDIHDTASNLLVDEEKTYALIEKMLQFWSKSVRSRVVHIGMDESWGIGSGRFKETHPDNPNESQFTIIARHLNRVSDLCRKYGLTAIMWGDMWFRIASKTGNQYDRSLVIPEEIKRQIPENVQLCYWDYYNRAEDDYHFNFRRYRELHGEPLFASGAWSWSLFWYNAAFTNRTAGPGIRAARQDKVRDVLITIWGDDGAYCDFESSFAGLTELANTAYQTPHTKHPPCARDQHAALHGEDTFNAVMRLSLECNAVWTSLVWDDPLILHVSSFLHGKNPPPDGNGKPIRWLDLTKNLSRILSLLNHCPVTEYGMGGSIPYARALVAFLLAKMQLVDAIVDAYRKPVSKRRSAIRATNLRIRRYMTALENLQVEHRNMWMTNNRPQGYETIQIRLAGMLERARECQRRLQDYANGEIPVIPELEDALKLWGKYSTRINNWADNAYGTIIT